MTRWEEISAAVKQWYQRARDDQFAAGQIAASIGNNLGDYLGFRDRIRFYKYEPGDTPKYDKMTPEPLGINAVSPSEDGRWQFGLGAILELAPRAEPQFEFKWPVIFNLAPPHLIEIPPLNLRINAPVLNTREAFEPVSAAIYQAMLESFQRAATLSPLQYQQIGFGIAQPKG